MKTIIEKASKSDLPEINSIYNHFVKNSNVTFDIQQWSEQKRINWFEQFESPESIYNLLVVRSANGIIAFAYNSKFKEKPAYATSSEVTVYVKRGEEGNGLGGKLYQQLFQKLSNSGLHRLYAAITLPNESSIRLHEKFGFKKIARLDEVGFKNDRYHSTVMFEKKI